MRGGVTGYRAGRLKCGGFEWRGTETEAKAEAERLMHYSRPHTTATFLYIAEPAY